MSFTPHPIVAKNGQQVRVRFLTPDDGDLLVNLVPRLSRETRYQRFHVSMDDVPVEEIRRRLPPFLAVDGVNNVALIALVDEPKGERAIAVARFGRRAGEAEAEAAVVVRDDWHRQGIGSAMMVQLVAMGRSVGITRFTAMAQAGNRPVHALIKAVGLRFESHIDRAEDYLVIHLKDETL
jgi:GNAT superfamily N-acetyltransferase